LPPAGRDSPQVFPAEGERKLRVALLAGCAQRVLAPEINEATIRLLTRHGCEVVIAEGAGCCGALTHHLGQDGHGFARGNIDAWTRGEPYDAIVINASGCGTTVKDYGFMFREDPAYAARAASVAALACDVTELLTRIGLRAPTIATGQRVAYHSACSMQHGQSLTRPPRALLTAAGFEVAEIAEGHLCCGSAGTYNLLQPVIADQLRARKLAHIEETGATIVATGNIGCITQLNLAERPVLHTVELLDWATGGPRPAKLLKDAA
jgi:glycolate oxidase iron-sulfur subunit